MIKKNYSKFEVKEEFGTLSFNNVLLYREDTKMYQVIFLSLLSLFLILLMVQRWQKVRIKQTNIWFLIMLRTFL